MHLNPGTQLLCQIRHIRNHPRGAGVLPVDVAIHLDTAVSLAVPVPEQGYGFPVDRKRLERESSKHKAVALMEHFMPDSKTARAISAPW